MTWGKLIRIVIKAAILFALCNLVYALVNPLTALSSLSLYNALVPGRARLPYGENPAASYSLTMTNLPAMFASHEISRPKAADEYRVVVIGDSGTWGWLLEHDETFAAQLEALGYTSADGRRIEVYNLGYPGMALEKDGLILQEAMQYEPDLIIWLVTLQSFPRDRQSDAALVQQNAADSSRLFWEQTLVGQRREIADWLRLQIYGFAWAATGVDQVMPDEITLRQSDFEPDSSWFGYDQAAPLTDLVFPVLEDGIGLIAERSAPLLLVNEPIYISSGQNSDIRYNSFYPRWAYDQYRELLAAWAGEQRAAGFTYLDLWDSIPPDEFTDTPVHLTVDGTQMLAERVGEELESLGWVRR